MLAVFLCSLTSALTALTTQHFKVVQGTTLLFSQWQSEI